MIKNTCSEYWVQFLAPMLVSLQLSVILVPGDQTSSSDFFGTCVWYVFIHSGTLTCTEILRRDDTAIEPRISVPNCLINTLCYLFIYLYITMSSFFLICLLLFLFDLFTPFLSVLQVSGQVLSFL